MKESPETNVQAIQRLRDDANRKATSWLKAGDWFASTYYQPLLAFVRAKLAATNVPPELGQNAEDYLQAFLAREWEDFPVCSGWDSARGHFHPYLRTAVSNFVDSRLSQDSPPGTPDEYQRHRKALEEHVRQKLWERLDGKRRGSRVKPPGKLLLVEDYVQEFLVYYSSRHPRPPRPRHESSPTAGEGEAADRPEKKSEQEAILARLKQECWNYVLDESRRRQKRRGYESLEGRTDGWEPEGRAISPSLAYARTWAIDLLFEALAAWRGTCAAPRRWKLVVARVLKPFYTGRGIPSYKEIYEDCDYESPKQAANDFAEVKTQIMKSLLAVIRERASRFQQRQASGDGGGADQRLEARIDEDLQTFQAILEEDNFWHHSAVTEGERDGKGIKDYAVLRRYAERKLAAAGALHGTSDPSESSGPEPDPDLSQFGLYAVAQAFASDRESNAELARQWGEQVYSAWLAQLSSGAAADALCEQARAVGIAAEASLSDLLRHPQTPVELLTAIRETVRARRNSADEETSDRVFKAMEQACVAAALATYGQRITGKEDDRVLKHLDRLIERRWLDEPTRELALRARARIAAPT